MELKDKICVITGGTSGIGRTTVERFVEEGAKVVFCGRRQERGEQAVAVLPGPPMELKDMFDRELALYLARRSGAHIVSRFLRIFGVGESMVETRLQDLFHGDNPTLALYCGPGEVTARISARVAVGQDARPLIDPMDVEIRRRLGDAVYAEGLENTIARTVLSLLLARGERVSFAESLTGGRLAGCVIDCPGASGAVDEAHVVYANAAKERVLGVRPETLSAFGAVSEQCAREMAEGARTISGADWAVSTTGIAGPDGGTPEKPVGLVYVGVASKAGCRVEKFQFRGSRDWIRTLTCSNALNLLRMCMLRTD